MKTSEDISRAVIELRRGGVIAYPTEAVWGLGCDPHNRESVERLLQIKKRPVEKGLILIAADYTQLDSLLAELPSKLRMRFMEERERPTTWIVPDRKNIIPSWVRGSHSSVAIRVSKHPLASALCREFGDLLISTSANEAGEKELRSQEDVSSVFGAELNYIVAGRVGEEREPSQIVDLESGKILR